MDWHSNPEFVQAMNGPLPNGLVALDFEIQFLAHVEDWEDEESDLLLDHLFAVLDCLGGYRMVRRDEVTVFGTSTGDRFRSTIVTTEEIVRAWFTSEDKVCLSRFPVRFRLRHQVTHARSVNSLRDLVEKESWRFGLDWQKRLFVLLDLKNGSSATDFGSFVEWLQAGQLTEHDLVRLHDLGELSRWNGHSMAEALLRAKKSPPANSFLVPGLVPDGAPTLLLGNKKTGKSTALLELCVAVARRESSWLGFPINRDRRGFAVYLCGEDSESEVLERVRRMTDGETPLGLHIINAFGTDLDDILNRLDNENVRLLAIDPARKFFKGDEDGSDQVSDLFNRIEHLTKSKNCATVLTHHLKRESNPRTVADVGERVRGSGVWLERPRVVLGMLRTANDETHFGISGPPDAPLHNFRRDVMFKGVRRLRRDDATSRHIPIDGTGSSSARQALTIKEKETVLSAMKSVLMSGERITRTGQCELYKHAPTEIRGWGRAKTRNAVEELIRDRQLLLNSDSSIGIIDSSAAGTRTDA